MSSREHREYRETRTSTVRSMAPRPMSPQQQLDSNLDSILEDLQASVSRPGSALGMNGGTNYSTREVKYERSLSPSYQKGVPQYGADGEHKVYKTTTHKSYNVSSDGREIPITRETTTVRQHNINQLDSLLEDLQQVREGTLDNRGTGSVTTTVTNVGIDPGLLEPIGSSTPRQGSKSVTRSSRTTYSGDVIPMETTRSHHRSPSPGGITYSRTETTTRDVFATDSAGRTYRGTSPLRLTGPGAPALNAADTTRSFSYTDHKTSSTLPGSVKTRQPPVITEVTADDLPIPLTQDILPPAATKVTTTVRTYTYELPGDAVIPGVASGYRSDGEISRQQASSQQHSAVSYKHDSASAVRGEREAYAQQAAHGTSSASASYKQHESEFSSSKQTQGGHPVVSSDPARVANTVVFKEETSKKQHSYQPQGGSYKQESTTVQSYQTPQQESKSMSQSYKYSSSSQERSSSSGRMESGRIESQSNGHARTMPFPTETTPYRTASEVDAGPPKRLDDLMASFGSSAHSEGYNGGMHSEKHVTLSTQGSGSGSGQGYAHGSGQGSASGHGQSSGYTQGQSAGYAHGQSSGYAHGQSSGYAHGQSSGFAQGQGSGSGAGAGYGQGAGSGMSEARVTIPSRNIAGPPVYYPPGHEMFARKEASGSYAAGGARGGAAGGAGGAGGAGAMQSSSSAAASGWSSSGGGGGGGYSEEGKMKAKYKYESQSKSKSKSKDGSGATVVPVCLPLCCGLPCVIM